MPKKVTLGYQVKITFQVQLPKEDDTQVEVLLVKQDLPWTQLPTETQMELILDAFKLCEDENLNPVRGSGRFKIDRIIFDLVQ